MVFELVGSCDKVVPARINALVLMQLPGIFLGIYIFHVHGGENLKSLTPDISKAIRMPGHEVIDFNGNG
jgi:dihydroxyacid dehydratase/phosphogluconate dehydratase